MAGIRSNLGNPCDGHTLNDQLTQAETLTATTPKNRGGGSGLSGPIADPDASSRKTLGKRQKRHLRRQSAIETMIGHMKNDGLLDRSHLKGTLGAACDPVRRGSQPAIAAKLLASAAYLADF